MTSHKPHRPRLDATENLVRVFQGANRDIAPPDAVHIDPVAWPFWNNIVAEYAKADWTDHQLEIAALLARSMAELEAEQRLLHAEGTVYVRANGDRRANPRSRLVSDLVSRVLAYRRSLGIHARAKAGRSEDGARQRERNRQLERDALSIDDRLLARRRDDQN